MINGLPALGRQRRPQGQRARSTCRATRAPASCSTCYNIVQPRNVMPVHGEIRRISSPTPTSRCAPGWTPSGVVVAEDGVVVDLVRRRVVGRRARSSAATSSSTARPSARSTRPPEGPADPAARRASSRSSSSSTPSPGKIVAGPEIHARGFVEDDVVFDEITPRIEQALLDATVAGRHRLPPAPADRASGRRAAGSSASIRRRPMIIPVGHRGLSPAPRPGLRTSCRRGAESGSSHPPHAVITVSCVINRIRNCPKKVDRNSAIRWRGR